METDALGFMYPKVDADKCVNCGLCDRVCAFSEPPISPNGYPETYLMRHKNSDEVLKSKSGAAFVALSDVVLSEGGIVYGARLNTEHLVEHAAAKTAKERDEFRGSKYIQSDLNGIFAQIKSNLIANKTVLFSGTPCQVAGLKAFIGAKLSKNLYLVDILCHGVASPAIWKDYLKHIEKHKQKKIRRCIPRNPEFGWDNCVDTFILDDDSVHNSDYFTGYIYHKWITQRWSCNVCPFTSLNRVSDVTIGDAWGYNKVAPGFDPENKGCSVVLINTPKGKHLFETASGNIVAIPADINKMMQPVMKHPTVLHPKRKAFEEAYSVRGFKYVRMIYLNNTFAATKTLIRHSLRRIKHLILELV